MSIGYRGNQNISKVVEDYLGTEENMQAEMHILKKHNIDLEHKLKNAYKKNRELKNNLYKEALLQIKKDIERIISLLFNFFKNLIN